MSQDTWTIGEVLTFSTSHFAKRGIDSPRLDAELLLAATLGKDRVYLYTHYDQPLSHGERAAYRALVLRRAKREPVAYILGEREFYGLPFTVTPAVLVPRPETEHLIDAVRDFLATRNLAAPRLADVGTGSGAIAVALATHAPTASVVATDISLEALAIARVNATRNGVVARIDLRAGDLLTPITKDERFDVIAANLPYIPARERRDLMAEVASFEPALALFGGEDGLDLITRLIEDAPQYLAPAGLLALELGAGQWPRVEAMLRAREAFDKIRAAADLQGHRRVALAHRA